MAASTLHWRVFVLAALAALAHDLITFVWNRDDPHVVFQADRFAAFGTVRTTGRAASLAAFTTRPNVVWKLATTPMLTTFHDGLTCIGYKENVWTLSCSHVAGSAVKLISHPHVLPAPHAPVRPQALQAYYPGERFVLLSTVRAFEHEVAVGSTLLNLMNVWDCFSCPPLTLLSYKNARACCLQQRWALAAQAAAWRGWMSRCDFNRQTVDSVVILKNWHDPVVIRLGISTGSK